MEKITRFTLRHKGLVLAIFMIILLVSAVLIPMVEINYDLATYLPEESATKKGISVMQEEFGYPSMADVMVEDVTVSEALSWKEKIAQVDGVKSVMWLDDVADPTQPLSYLPEGTTTGFYKDGAALFKVEFTKGDYDLSTGQTLKEIRALDEGNGKIAISSAAENNAQAREYLFTEIILIIVWVVPLCVLVLMFAAKCWIEPFIYLAVIGVSIGINMGTNLAFGSISMITSTIAGVLQLAISLDYSLFLMHRYFEERDNGLSVQEAVVRAVRKSLSSVAASALTTIAGFLALVFMRYEIGMDIGLVLAKGIVISFLCVVVLMPVVLVVFSKIIEKTRHRSFLPPLRTFGKATIKGRFVILGLMAVIMIPAFLAQQNNAFIYGSSTATSQEGAAGSEAGKIGERFGTSNPVVVLVQNGNIPAEIEVCRQLEALEGISSVQTIVTLADPSIPRAVLPQAVKDNFISEHYTRMVVSLGEQGESQLNFETVGRMQEILQQSYPDGWHWAGEMTSISDIKSTVDIDSMVINLFSILSVGLIILLIFRSLSIPVLLVLVIQCSIWLNMSVPYFQGGKLIFIGYLVVSSLQLGATIDYAILMSNRYLEFRRTSSPREAAVSALGTAGNSVIVSALILTVTGFAVNIISTTESVSEIGLLIGRGALLSGLLVLGVLPSLLVVCDKLIAKTTLRSRNGRKRGVQVSQHE